MHTVGGLLGIALIGVVLWDAFETVILPRSISRRLRLTALFYRFTWRPWAAVARRMDAGGRRDRFLAIFGPASLIGLSIVWAVGLLLGFGLVHWGLGSRLYVTARDATFVDDLYMSGTTLFTLGLGDVHPLDGPARLLTVAEAGTGFAFLALVIAYFPVFYQSFSKREVRLTMLDAWAGSPPAGAEVLRRLAHAGDLSALDPFLRDWEYWCSEVLESHLSYPGLAFFRSQHQHQSWVSALSTVLDLAALVRAGVAGVSTWQARLTFAMARHAAVDLSQALRTRPDWAADRLSADDLEQMRRQLEAAGLRPDRSPDAEVRLLELRRSYEPYVVGLARVLMMPTSHWWHRAPPRDNWETSPKRDGGGHL